jgi:hypothetical protein
MCWNPQCVPPKTPAFVRPADWRKPYALE